MLHMLDLSSLNPEQEKAVTHGTGPLLIIAGAGTGKTTVITKKIEYLILEKNISPSEILALTFTEKAAREMEERIDVSLPYGYTQMWISTFHAFCDRILRDEALHIGLNPAFKLATESESMMLLRKNLFQFNLSYFRPLGNPFKFLGGLLQHFNRLKDDDITPEQYITFAGEMASKLDSDPDEVMRVMELAQAYKLYEELKVKEGIMDFSDLNAHVLKLFRTRHNVLSYYQDKFKYILVDEFQDTNFAQNELAILMAGERQNITVVGDDDQAIYRWRGAALANIIQFREHFPTAKIVALTKNYRSTAEILNTAYTMIQHNNPERLEVKEKINKRLEAMRDEKGDKVEFLFGNRVENEADLVVQKIHELIKKKKISYKDVAILVRANDHAQPFTRALERAGIPFQFLGPGHLFHQEEIKDLIAYLKVLYNFEDSASMYRVLCNQIFDIEARDIAAILNFAKKKNLSLFEASEQISDSFLNERVKQKVTEIVEMIKKHLKRVPHDSAGQILYYFFEDSGLLKTFIDPKNTVGERRAQNIAKFFEKLKGFEAEHQDSSVFAVIDWIDLSLLLGESPLSSDSDWSENDAVSILTIHSSKGLEFPVVFVTNLVTQRFPSRDRKDQIPIPEALIREGQSSDDSNISEERRLFYVACTRARDNLFLTAANFYGEGKRERKLSPFLMEALGEEYIKSNIAKEKARTAVKQLSLLDIINISSDKALQEEGLQNVKGSNGNPFYPVNYISYSQIQTFEMCPLHYKLKYILKVPPFPSPALSFGSSIHAVLRDYYSAKIKQLPPEEIAALLKRNWIAEGYTSKSHAENALQQAEKIIKNYLAQDNGIIPSATEIPFQFFLKNIRVGGRIDRVDSMKDGKVEIIDYKTGVNVPDDKKLATDMQLTMYALAATEVRDQLFNKHPQDVSLSLHYVEAEKKLTTMRTIEQLQEAKEYILQKAEEISKSDFLCTGTNCKNCEYSIICQTYSG